MHTAYLVITLLFAIMVAFSALVKKVVFDEAQCFPRNSTMQGGMCVKPEKV